MSDKSVRLPPGFVYDEAEGAYRAEDPWLQNMRWPDVRIDSADFKTLPVHTRLYQLSRAYLRAATSLCENAGALGNALTWPDASACYYCLYLSTELFLKACIKRKEATASIATHEIADLLREYKRLTPPEHRELWLFPTPWFASAKDLASLVGQEVLVGIDKTPDQLYRYGADKKDNPSGGVQMFAPGYFLNYMEHLADRWEGIWASIGSTG